mgnify:CR=1 FL=1
MTPLFLILPLYSDTASVPNPASAPEVAPVPDSESSVNTTVPDAAEDVPTSPAVCDQTEITMEEVIKQISSFPHIWKFPYIVAVCQSFLMPLKKMVL